MEVGAVGRKNTEHRTLNAELRTVTTKGTKNTRKAHGIGFVPIGASHFVPEKIYTVEHGERKTRFHQPRVVLLGHNRDEECLVHSA